MTQEQADQILYLSRKDVESLCYGLDSVAIIREAFELHSGQQTVLPDEAYLGWQTVENETVRSLNMPAYLGGSLQIAGTKIINGNISNPRRGLPRASGLTLLFDPVSVRVMCILEGAYISSLRTASVSVLAAELYASRSLQAICCIGAGVLAQAHIELLLARRSLFPSLQIIHLFDIDPDRMQAMAQRLAPLCERAHVRFSCASSAEEAVRASQLIIPTTTTTRGYIPYAWLQPGAVLINVSLDDALPDVVLQADQVIVDDWHLVKSDTRRLLGRMYRAGQLLEPDDVQEPIAGQQRRVDAQLGEVVSGQKAGRRHEDEIILVNPFGLAIEDIALAAHIYQAARVQGLGTWLER